MVVLVFSKDAHADTIGICMSSKTVRTEDSGESMIEVLVVKHATCWRINYLFKVRCGSLDKMVMQAPKPGCRDKSEQRRAMKSSALVAEAPL